MSIGTEPRRRQRKFLGGEKRGAKPIVCGDDPAKLTVRMPGNLFDRIYVHARARGLTVAQLARELLESGLKSDSQAPEV